MLAVSSVAICCGTVFAAFTSGHHPPGQPVAQAPSTITTSANQLGTAEAATAAPQPSGAALTTTEITPPPSANLCSAPPNPYGYNFCGGSVITDPPSDICTYLNCVNKFWNGNGFIVECQDNTFSKTGGTDDVCPKDDGYLKTLYQ
jgi:hypothetical protein